MTFEKGETAKDMLKKLHPGRGESSKYQICVIGYAAGASITTSTSRAENHGFEVNLDSTPLSDLKELGIKTLEVTCISINIHYR